MRLSLLFHQVRQAVPAPAVRSASEVGLASEVQVHVPVPQVRTASEVGPASEVQVHVPAPEPRPQADLPPRYSMVEIEEGLPSYKVAIEM